MTGLEVPEDMLSDYNDGYSRMESVASHMSSLAMISYAEDAGPKLDKLVDESSFFSGMRASLVNTVCNAIHRLGGSCSWLDGRTVNVDLRPDGTRHYTLAEKEESKCPVTLDTVD